MARLRVGQAFGVLLLPGFGVGSSSPQVPGHATFMCNSGMNKSIVSTQYNVEMQDKLHVLVFNIES